MAHEKKQMEQEYERKLKAQTKERERWESQYRTETTERALLDAAVSGDAFNTDTLAAVLRPMTSLSEIVDEKTGKGTGKFRPTVEFPDTDPNTGEPIVVQHTPQSAVRRMKELPKYVNLFKSGVVGGAGANSGGLTPAQTAKSTCGRRRRTWKPTWRFVQVAPSSSDFGPSKKVNIGKFFFRDGGRAEQFARPPVSFPLHRRPVDEPTWNTAASAFLEYVLPGCRDALQPSRSLIGRRQVSTIGTRKRPVA